MEGSEFNKACPMNNLKCKECKMLDCKKKIENLEEEEKVQKAKQKQILVEELKKQFPFCINKEKICSYLDILNLEKRKVRCPYMINQECVLQKTNFKLV